MGDKEAQNQVKIAPKNVRQREALPNELEQR